MNFWGINLGNAKGQQWLGQLTLSSRRWEWKELFVVFMFFNTILEYIVVKWPFSFVKTSLFFALRWPCGWLATLWLLDNGFLFRKSNFCVTCTCWQTLYWIVENFLDFLFTLLFFTANLCLVSFTFSCVAIAFARLWTYRPGPLSNQPQRNSGNLTNKYFALFDHDEANPLILPEIRLNMIWRDFVLQLTRDLSKMNE